MIDAFVIYVLFNILYFLFDQVHIGDTPHNLTETDFEHLARRTQGFSGSDIFYCVSVNFTLCQCVSKGTIWLKTGGYFLIG